MFETMLSVAYNSIAFILFLLFITIFSSVEGIRYRVKFVFFVVWSAILTTTCIPLMLPRLRDWRNALIPAWGITKVAKLIGITFRIRGKENIVKNTGCVVLINHQSALDLCVLGELWPVLERCTVVSKKEVLYLGPFGWASWLWGTIFINRGSGDAHDTVNSTAKSIQNLKAKLLLFPEGHRHSGTSLKPFKKGAFHLAIASQTPIQPVVVSRYYFLNAKLKRFNSGISYITILPPISTEGLTKEDLPVLMDKAYETMNKTFLATSQETLNDYIDTIQNE